MVGLSIPYWPQFSFLGQPDILVGAFKALCSLILAPNTPPAPPASCSPQISQMCRSEALTTAAAEARPCR